MDAQISELVSLLQTIQQRERTSGLDAEATRSIQAALQTACDTCREVLYPAPVPVAKEEEQPQSRKSSSSSSSSSKADK